MDIQIIIPLLSLIALEAVLGIDNVIFISILSGKLPHDQQKTARRYGLILAGILRLGLLAIISLIMRLDKTLFSVLGNDFSGKDLVLLVGGLFLLYKSTTEIYHKVEGETIEEHKDIKVSSFAQVIVQILIMDLVFSIDSIITAIGLVKEVWVMYVAVIITVVIMLFAAETISNFVNKHPSFKMLALSFLLLIGFSLVGEGFGLHIPKGYIYFSMAFSLLVDILQMKMNKKSTTILPLHTEYKKDNTNK
jgi:predicted tellurium resistance membrane protein TerC